jgi:succinate dehydrogenase hydrophobic anchor subunit
MAAQRDRSGSLWLVQAFSGLLLVLILGLHMVAHHFIVDGGLRNYQQVLEYVANPAIFITEMIFVVVATVHALLGVKAIYTDLRPGRGSSRAVNWVLGIIGVVTIIYGVWLAIALQRMAT